MPTSTFFNLPKSKQDGIITASRNEFSRTTYNNVSINKIIQDAEISRGSFYAYFKDKKDLAYYLFKDYINGSVNEIKLSLEKNGDIFDAFIKLYDYTLGYNGNQNKELIKNLFISLRSGDVCEDNEIRFEDLISDRKCVDESIKSLIKTDNMRVKNDEEIMDLLFMLFSITKQSIKVTFFHSHSCDMYRQRFLNMINILKYGALKEL